MTATRLQSLGGQLVKPEICAFAVRLTSDLTVNATSAASNDSGLAVDYN